MSDITFVSDVEGLPPSFLTFGADDSHRPVTFADRANRWASLLRDRPSKTGTIEDLWQGVPENERTNYIARRRPIRLVMDTSIYPQHNYTDQPVWSELLKKAYIQHQAMVADKTAKGTAFWKPKFNRRIDYLRWWLHVKLLRWGLLV